MTDTAAVAAPPAAPSDTPPPSAPAAPAAPAAFDWKTSGLDPDGLSVVTAKGWKGPNDVVTSYRQLESVIGVPPERIIKLPKDTDPAAWGEVHAKLGRPKTAEEYVIPLPEGDKGEFANAVKPWLFKAGVSQAAATELATQWNTFIAETTKAQQLQTEAQHTAEVADLKKSWGPDYEARALVVDRAAESFGMTQPQLDALKTAMGPKAAMEFLHNIGSKIAVEDRTVPGLTQQAAGFGGMTPEMARAKIAEYSRPGSGFAKLFDSKDPKQRMEAHAEWTKLHQLAAQAPPESRA